MPLQLFNSRTKQKELFTPIDAKHIKVYVCGPTVYDFVHIGNGLSAVVFDVLYRLLQTHYPKTKVTYIRNITDIDDRINEKYQQTGVPIEDITQKMTQAYQEHTQALGCLKPTHEPKATHHTDQMIQMIQMLLDKGHAYVAEHHVLFDVASYPAYGELSQRTAEHSLTGTRVESLSFKRNAADFVLWKPSTDDLPGWDSPWGRGRPGWHLECTAMIHAHLGTNIDIHGGGRDLLFPHHENELAQGRCLSDDCNYVNYWVHNGMLQVEQSKMSKSLGNFTTVAELLQKWDGETLRYALLSGHYRGELDWSERLLMQAKTSLDKLYRAISCAPPIKTKDEDLFLQKTQGDIMEALNDDINTPVALSILHKKASEIFKNPKDKKSFELAQEIKIFGQKLLGIFQQTEEQRFQFSKNMGEFEKSKIETLISSRKEAKNAKNFNEADRIRDELSAMGVEIEDTRDGTSWHYSTHQK